LSRGKIIPLTENESDVVPLHWYRWCCNKVSDADLVSKDQVCRNRVCTKHLSRMMCHWKDALGFREPASRRSFVPACRPDQNGGFSRVIPWESSYYGGSGAGQHTETVVVAPPYENVGARVSVQSIATDSGGISLWRSVRSVMQSDRLREAP